MNLHREINFEAEICAHLAAHGWLHADGDAAQYDRARALFPADVIAWVQTAQPGAWQVLEKNHGAAAGETLLARLRDGGDLTGRPLELLPIYSPAGIAARRLMLVGTREDIAGFGERSSELQVSGSGSETTTTPPNPQPATRNPQHEGH